MDSISQAALGAAVGQAALGPQVGRKALVWGAVVGTIPDLDVLAYPLMDQVTQLGWHRGHSHSFFFLALLTPLLAWLIWRLHGRRASWRGWMLLVYLAFITHILLDAFTVYGTQLFRPFTDLQAALNNISIIDPLFTVPLLLGLAGTLVWSRRRPRRAQKLNFVGLGLATGYIALTFVLKGWVGEVSERSLARQGIGWDRYMTAPTLFNSVLWRTTAQTDSGFWVGHYSLLDETDAIHFDFIPQQNSLLARYAGSPELERLKWFSQGYFIATEHDDQIRFHDLRFGEIGFPSDNADRQFVFTWRLGIDSAGEKREVTIQQLDMDVADPGAAMADLWNRLAGLEAGKRNSSADHSDLLRD